MSYTIPNISTFVIHFSWRSCFSDFRLPIRGQIKIVTMTDPHLHPLNGQTKTSYNRNCKQKCNRSAKQKYLFVKLFCLLRSPRSIIWTHKYFLRICTIQLNSHRNNNAQEWFLLGRRFSGTPCIARKIHQHNTTFVMLMKWNQPIGVREFDSTTRSNKNLSLPCLSVRVTLPIVEWTQNTITTTHWDHLNKQTRIKTLALCASARVEGISCCTASLLDSSGKCDIANVAIYF